MVDGLVMAGLCSYADACDMDTTRALRYHVVLRVRAREAADAARRRDA